MKLIFIIELSVMMVLTILYIIRALRFRREKYLPVIYLMGTILIPLLGNIIMCSAENPAICNAGYFLYLNGTSVVILALYDFTLQYCGLSGSSPYLEIWVRRSMWVVFGVDLVSLFLNSYFSHCFTLAPIRIGEDEVYYTMISGPGHIAHLLISGACLAVIVSIYFYKIYTSAALYLERYAVVLLVIFFVALWEYVTVLNEQGIDRPMLGLGLGGLLVGYFVIDYKQFLLRMELHNLLVKNYPDATIFFDSVGDPIYANDAARSLFGINNTNMENCARILGKEITGPDFIENGCQVEKNTYKNVEVFEDGQPLYYGVTCRRMEDRRGKYLGTAILVSDETGETKDAMRRVYNQTHDQLTGLFNREAFIEQVKVRCLTSPDEEYAMILSDIADFKTINDIYGRAMANQILISIADMIRNVAHPDTVYCRWGADQFALFGRKEYIGVKMVEDMVREWMAEDHTLKYRVMIHVGYYERTENSLSPSDMVDRCVFALATVEQSYQKIVGVYDDKLRQERRWEQRISSELQEALDKKQIFPYLQPQYDSRNVLTGAEVLVRWEHPTEGFLAPYKFVPIFEKNGMIVRVDQHIWEEACRILHSWKGTDKEKLHLSVNISSKEFYFLDLYDTFTGLVQKYDLDPGKLHLEITETVVMKDMIGNIRVINQLREYGFIVEMDDFGSGYSSLNLLRDMPVDVLKIDMAFLGSTKHPKKAETILDNIISLARQLNMISLAEGVEMEKQLDMLKEMGCNVFQGYFFAKPMPLEEFEKLAA